MPHKSQWKEREKGLLNRNMHTDFEEHYSSPKNKREVWKKVGKWAIPRAHPKMQNQLPPKPLKFKPYLADGIEAIAKPFLRWGVVSATGPESRRTHFNTNASLIKVFKYICLNEKRNHSVGTCRSFKYSWKMTANKEYWAKPEIFSLSKINRQQRGSFSGGSPGKNQKCNSMCQNWSRGSGSNGPEAYSSSPDPSISGLLIIRSWNSQPMWAGNCRY